MAAAREFQELKHGPYEDWAASAVDRCSASLKMLKTDSPEISKVNAVLESLRVELQALQSMPGATSYAGGALTLTEVNEHHFEDSPEVLRMLALPGNTILVGTEHGRLYQVSPDCKSSELLASGLGGISCVRSFPDGRILVGSADGRGYVLRKQEREWRSTFFSWSGDEVGHVDDMHCFADGRIIVVGRRGVFLWDGLGSRVGPEQLSGVSSVLSIVPVTSDRVVMLDNRGDLWTAPLTSEARSAGPVRRIGYHDAGDSMTMDSLGNIAVWGFGSHVSVWKQLSTRTGRIYHVYSFEGSSFLGALQPLQGGGFVVLDRGELFVLRENREGVWSHSRVGAIEDGAVPRVDNTECALDCTFRSDGALVIATQGEKGQQFRLYRSTAVKHGEGAYGK